jgi:hypothetical protein
VGFIKRRENGRRRYCKVREWEKEIGQNERGRDGGRAREESKE